MGRLPPLIGLAVKVTVVPETTGLAEAAMDTLTGKMGFTVMVIGLDVAGFPLTQAAFDVNIQVTTSLLLGI